MIIVEGCDGSGKSTLVSRLSADLGLSVGKRGTENRDELYKVTRTDTYTALALAVMGNKPPCIWDRLFFSEGIYSHIQGREPEFKSDETHFIGAVMKALRCPLIICHVPFDVAEENMYKAHQMDAVEESFEFIHSAYEGLINATRDWNVVYNYTNEEVEYEPMLEKLKSYLAKRKVREWHYSS